MGHYVTSKDFSIAIRRTREIQQVDNTEENKHAATAQQQQTPPDRARAPKTRNFTTMIERIRGSFDCDGL